MSQVTAPNANNEFPIICKLVARRVYVILHATNRTLSLPDIALQPTMINATMCTTKATDTATMHTMICITMDLRLILGIGEVNVKFEDC